MVKRLGSGNDGLAESDAALRLAHCGANVFRAPAITSPWTVLLGQLRSVLVVLLAIGAAVALATGDVPDAGAILAVLAINVGIGFVTELRAHRAMEALHGLEVLRARVVREGASLAVDAREAGPPRSDSPGPLVSLTVAPTLEPARPDIGRPSQGAATPHRLRRGARRLSAPPVTRLLLFADGPAATLRSAGVDTVVTFNGIPHVPNAIDVSGLLGEAVSQQLAARRVSA